MKALFKSHENEIPFYIKKITFSVVALTRFDSTYGVIPASKISLWAGIMSFTMNICGGYAVFILDLKSVTDLNGPAS